jgi:hypothetical protein
VIVVDNSGRIMTNSKLELNVRHWANQ